MFLRIERNVLLNAVKMAMRAVGGSSAVSQIYNYMLVENLAEGVRFTCRNSQGLCIQTAFVPNTLSLDKKEGKIALDAKFFAGVIEKLPAGELTIEVDDKFYATINQGKINSGIPGFDPKVFPAVEDFEPTNSITINGKTFKDMIDQTIFCASSDPSPQKVALTGQFIKISEGLMEICSVDGHRIAHAQSSIEYTGEGFHLLVPSKALAEASRLMPTKEGDEVKLCFDDKKVWLTFEGAKVISSLIEATFIEYEKMFGSTHTLSIKLNRAELLSSIDRATSIDGRITTVRLDINGSSMNISSRTALGFMDEDVEVKNNGDKLTIFFNSLYLLDALKAMSSEEAEIFLDDPNKPGIIRPTDSTDCKYLMLPINPISAEAKFTTARAAVAKAA